MTRRNSHLPRQRSGFTLIELMVVLALAAVISAVTLGGFKEMRDGNKRVSCNTNLTQLYQAARLYAADEGGNFPYFANDCAATPVNSGIGLWSLYGFPQGETVAGFDKIAPVGGKPIERYLRSTKLLHCPADEVNDQLYADPENKVEYNANFLSYQACDNGGETPGVPGFPTYSTRRTDDISDPNWKRQLLHYDSVSSKFIKRLPEGSTIVTYCLHHRRERNMDNVLFYDGSIQLLPSETNPADNWKRQPKSLQ
jgi:prepilin-type N-terminal cleavage/methylation domain-containing protein